MPHDPRCGAASTPEWTASSTAGITSWAIPRVAAGSPVLLLSREGREMAGTGAPTGLAGPIWDGAAGGWAGVPAGTDGSERVRHMISRLSATAPSRPRGPPLGYPGEGVPADLCLYRADPVSTGWPSLTGLPAPATGDGPGLSAATGTRVAWPFVHRLIEAEAVADHPVPCRSCRRRARPADLPVR